MCLRGQHTLERKEKWSCRESVWPHFITHTLFFFLDRVSLCSLGLPGTLSADQADLELKRDPRSGACF